MRPISARAVPPAPPARPQRRRDPGRALATVAALTVLCALAALSTTARTATAQTNEGTSDLRLSILELTGSMSPGGELRVHARISNQGRRSADGLRVVGTLHRSVASRFAFQMAVDDGQLGPVIDGLSTDVGPLAGGGSAVTELERSAAELGFRRADQFGVYPLRLQLLDDGEVVDEVRTAMVFTGEDVDEPVRASLLVPVITQPVVRPDGTYDRQVLLGELGSAGRVQGLVGGLAVREGFPATLVADPLLLETAADLVEGFTLRDDAAEREVGPDDHLATQAQRLLERIQEVADRRTVDLLGIPYGRADLTALVRGHMTSEAARHVGEGARTLDRLTGNPPMVGALWPPDAIDPTTLVVLDGAGVGTIVASERHLDISEARGLSPSPVRTLARTRGLTPTLLVPDPWLEEVLAGEHPDGVAIAVQRVLAETAAVYFERPFAQNARGLLLAPPQSWSPPRGFAGALMDALDDAPWIHPVTLSELARTVEPEARSVRLDAQSARTRELSSSYVSSLAEARRALGSLAQVLAVSDGTPSRFDRVLRAAASVAFRGSAEAEGRALITAVSGTVAQLYSAVTIEEGPQVWMEAEGPVPVTVSNDADVPVRVRVRLESQRFLFSEEPIGQPADADGGWVIPAGDSRTLTFQASAVTRGGRAPISVVVEDIDGVIVLARDTLVVRSTAVSIAALVVTGAAGFFLLVWLVRQASRRRRSRPDIDAPTARQPTAQA